MSGNETVENNIIKKIGGFQRSRKYEGSPANK